LRVFFNEKGYDANMDMNLFDPKLMTGKLLPLNNGDLKYAFLPDPLPPKWSWPASLWKPLIEARKSLSSLDGTGKHLPNPEILLQPLQSREAQLSSQLEGIFTDPQQQVLFEADPQYPTSKNDPNNAYQEVYNYRRALRLKLDNQTDLPLSLRLVRELHQVLMWGVRGSDQRPGEFREIQNQIGFPARFVPPPPTELRSALDALEKYLHADSEFDPLVRAFLTHYQFEAIHPFRDGNGRVGRLLLSLAIAEWCELSGQWLYMSPFFEKRKKEYMELLFNVSAQGSWEAWLKFCLEGVVLQSIDAEKRCDKLLKLQIEFRNSIKGGSYRLTQLIDYLFVRPVITVTQYAGRFGVSYPTARLDLKKLEQAGVVQPLEGLETITYYCSPIYRITYEDIDP
jgi:Fic family protein